MKGNGSNNEKACIDKVENLSHWCPSVPQCLQYTRTAHPPANHRHSALHQRDPWGECQELQVPGCVALWKPILSNHTERIPIKSKQCLYHLRQLRESRLLNAFYTVIESIVFYGASLPGTAAAPSGTVKPYRGWCAQQKAWQRPTYPPSTTSKPHAAKNKAKQIMKDSTHWHNLKFRMLRSGQRLCSPKARTERMRRYFQNTEQQ